MDKSLGRALYARYSVAASTPDRHAPRVVVIAHPLLDAAALVRQLTEGPSFFVQSCGTPTASGALADKLYNFLVERAGLSTEYSRASCTRFLACDVFCAHWVQLAVSFRVEQMAAVTSMRDRGMAPQSAHDYLALCSRDVRSLLMAVEDVKSEFMSRTHDSEPSDAEYSPEFYTEQRSTLARVSTTLEMDVDDLLQPFLGELVATRQFAGERHQGEVVSVPRIEVFTGAWWADRELLALANASIPVELGAMCRAESMMAARTYDANNTVVLVVDVGRERVQAALAALHEQLCQEFGDTLGQDTRCAVITELASICEAAASRVANAAQTSKHVLRVQFEDRPCYSSEPGPHTPSMLAACAHANQIIEAALSTYVQHMCDGRPWKNDFAITEQPVPGSQGAMFTHWDWHGDAGATVQVTSLGTTAGRAEVPLWTEQYRGLFGHAYEEGEFHVHIAARPQQRTASVLLQADSDDDEPDLMGVNSP